MSSEAIANANEVLNQGEPTAPPAGETQLDRLLKGLPPETKAEVLDVIRKEKILDEDDILIQTIRIMSIFSILNKELAKNVRESVDQAFQLSEHTISSSDISRLETTAEELKTISDEISQKYGKVRGATYAIHSIALTISFVQGTLIGFLMAENIKVAAILIGTFLLGLFISSFFQKSWKLIKIWFLKQPKTETLNS